MEHDNGVDERMELDYSWDPSTFLADSLYEYDPALADMMNEFLDRFPYHNSPDIPLHERREMDAWFLRYLDVIYEVLHKRRGRMTDRTHLHQSVVKP